jgi:excisionase family DNA binding protein
MTKETPAASEWVSLRDAAEMLGVHPATVRNWADRGDLPMRRTPGGHRRFRRDDLEQWLETRQTPPPAEVQMLIQSAMGKMRLHIGDGEMGKLDWYNDISEEGHAVMRRMGRQIMEMLQNYLADRYDSDEDDERVRAFGREYAVVLMKEGLSLYEVMQGFLLFADFLNESALNIVEVVNVRPPTEWLNLLRMVRHFINEMLLGLTEAYGQLKGESET